jgi:hypothetical protein
VKWFETIKVLPKRLKERRMWPVIVFVASMTIAIAAWLCWPSILRPYVRVTNPTFALSVRCIPESVQLELVTRYATLERSVLNVVGTKPPTLRAQYDLAARPVSGVEGVNIIVASPTKEQLQQVRDAVSRQRDPTVLNVSFIFARIPAVDLQKATLSYADQGPGCQPETLASNDLLAKLGDKSARVMRYTLIRDKLSDIILGINEVAGNALLTGLTLMFLWLVVLLVDALHRVYLVSDQQLHEDLENLVPATQSDRRLALEQIVKADYFLAQRRLAFMRVFGPATGFLLTVSSLIAGLHPSEVAAKDTFAFVSSLQLALVATFMGLVVRIMAELVLRYRRDDAERRLDTLSKA